MKTERLDIKKRDINRKPWELRAQGIIPGSLYGPDIESTPVKLHKQEMWRADRKSGGLFKVSTAKGPKYVKFLDVQKDPVSGEYVHFSLVELPKDKENSIEVPVKLKGTPEGIKNGGVLMVLKDSLNVHGMLKDIPERIEERVDDMKIGDTLTVEDIHLRKDVDVEEQDDTVIAICQPPIKTEEEMKNFIEPLPTEEMVAVSS